MKFFKSFLVLSCLYSLSACFPVMAPTKIESGSAWFDNDITEGVQEVSSKESSQKIGKSCVQNYLYMVSVGDASINRSKVQGNITNISRIERQKSGFGFVFFLLPIIYGESCTIVYGN
jgi:hypothetical protein